MWRTVSLLGLVLNILFSNILFDNNIVCNENLNPEKKATTAPLPEFRRRVEEIIDDTGPPITFTEDPSQHIVSFLIQNVKEIFKDTYDSDSDSDSETQMDSVNDLRRKESTEVYDLENSPDIEKIADTLVTLDSSKDSTFGEKKRTPDLTVESETIPPNKKIKQEKHKVDSEYAEDQNNEIEFNAKLLRPFNHKVKPDLDHQKNENDVQFKPEDEQIFRTSTLMFRPNFQIVTHSDEENVEFYFESTPKKLIYSEFMNISQPNESKDWPRKFQKIIPDDDVLEKPGFVDRNSLPFLINRKLFEPIETRKPNTAKGLMFLAGPENNKSTVKSNRINKSNRSSTSTASSESGDNSKEPKRSCIKCDNAAIDWCSVPKNKLIPSIICKRQTDICYSMHTPFGIVDRGCYNINHNMTTYVCGCNICNYIPFADLPIFMSKQEWIHDVYELSRLKHLRQSTMRGLNCLKCEVNSTSKGDVIYNTNCMEGNVGAVQTTECQKDEVCGIKSVKIQGYIWRGCMNTPLYNYYITMCDLDLCNYEPIASIYDTND